MAMSHKFSFDPIVFNSLVGGLTSLEIPKLNVQSLDDAKKYINNYGYDIDNEEENKRLWAYHRRAVTFIQTELLNEGESIPEVLSDPNQLKNIAYLLIYASTKGDFRETSLQRWSCAILKVTHALVHLENDLFFQFSKEIQDQIFKPIQEHVYSDSILGTFLGSSSSGQSIPLKKFAIKPFKRSDSSVTKLLAKPEMVAFTILDKMGVRFVTKHLFDVFRVMRYLVENHVVSLPHNVPDQSNNTLYPLNYFFEVIETLVHGKDYSPEDLDLLLKEKLEKSGVESAEFLKKENNFTSANYKFLKFITRRLIKIQMPNESKPMTFFYPYEIQIMDYQTYLDNMQGSSSHDEYKLRQKRKARARVLGFSTTEGDKSENDS